MTRAFDVRAPGMVWRSFALDEAPVRCCSTVSGRRKGESVVNLRRKRSKARFCCPETGKSPADGVTGVRHLRRSAATQ